MQKLIPRLHEEAYMKQTWSKRIQNRHARRLLHAWFCQVCLMRASCVLHVCFMFASSCKRGIKPRKRTIGVACSWRKRMTMVAGKSTREFCASPTTVRRKVSITDQAAYRINWRLRPGAGWCAYNGSILRCLFRAAAVLFYAPSAMHRLGLMDQKIAVFGLILLIT